MIEVQLREPDDFSKIRETLTRIGILSRKTQTLYQTAHILHKRGKYYITHFKEMFVLDGKETDFTEEDKQRRNLIISYLQDWGLLKVLNEDGILDKCESHMITVLPYGEKHKYTLQAKYTIGSRKSTSRVGSA